jgi:hypothetical protein
MRLAKRILTKSWYYGDEYYPFPHLYCDFSINGMPYESVENAVVGKDEYDWPLKPELRLSADDVKRPITLDER